MNKTPNNYVEVAQIGDAVIFRIIGLGNMNSVPAILALVDRMLSGGIFKFAFEMKACDGLDSTFMGTLVGIAKSAAEISSSGWVCVVNSTKKIDQSLENLGAAKFLRFKNSLPFEDIEMQRLDINIVSQEERLEAIRKAHEQLIEIDKRNVERFGPFLKSLRKELEE